MKIVFALLCALLCPHPTLCAKEEKSTASTELVDTLQQSNLQEAFRILLGDYIQRDQLSPLQINRAALDGLLRRLGLGAELIARNGDAKEKTGVFATVYEILPERVAYLRPGGFTETDLETVDTALTKFADAKCATLVLDFRVPMPDADFGELPRFLDRFCPPNQVLFKVSKPGGSKPRLFTSKPANKAWPGEIILLVDADSAGAPELAAAVVRKYRDCLVFGEQTAGRTVDYQTVNISDEAALRFAVAEAVLADDTSLFRTGIAPDVLTMTKRADKLAIFDQTTEKGVTASILDTERPTLNEAALVAGTNPELPYLLDKSAGRESEFDQVPVQDTALQRVVDFIKVRAFLGE